MTKIKILAITLLPMLVLLIGLYVWPKGESKSYDSIESIMQKKYGEYDAKNHYWILEENINTDGVLDFVYDICAKQDIKINGINHIMLAVCGFHPFEASHADHGYIDFYVLRKDSDGFSIAAISQGNVSGSYGVAGKVNVIKLGKSFYGFRVDEFWSGQGRDIGITSIYAPFNETFKSVFNMTSLFDNAGNGNCEAGESDCSQLERTVSVNTQHKEDRIYPLLVKEKGLHHDEKMNGVFNIQFDRQKWQYQVSESMGLDLD